MKRFRRYLILLSIFLHKGGYKRAEYLKKKKYFKKIGEHCYLQPYNFGTEPNLITFGNNEHVATGVTFINHDIISFMLNYMDNTRRHKEKKGEIVIGDNVFIGAKSIILYDVHIGNNVIIGAGTIVTKDIPSNSVVVGVPGRIISTFDDYKSQVY